MTDRTGEDVWDSGRLLASLLQCKATREALGLIQPRVVLELGAGTGELAMALVKDIEFSSELQAYVVTDLPSRVPFLEERTANARGLIRCAALPWGEIYSPRKLLAEADDVSAPDLVLAADVLYWTGNDLFTQDTLAPLATTLCSAIAADSMAVGLVTFRERWPEREAAFCELCCKMGFRVERCSPNLVQLHVPVEAKDPDTTGALVVLKLTRPITVFSHR